MITKRTFTLLLLKKISSGALAPPFRLETRAAEAIQVSYGSFKIHSLFFGKAGLGLPLFCSGSLQPARAPAKTQISESSPPSQNFALTWNLAFFGNISLAGWGNLSLAIGINQSGREVSLYPQLMVACIIVGEIQNNDDDACASVMQVLAGFRASITLNLQQQFLFRFNVLDFKDIRSFVKFSPGRLEVLYQLGGLVSNCILSDNCHEIPTLFI